MKFQVAKCDLEAALQVVSSSLGSGSSDDISSHLLFRARKNDKGEWKGEVLTYTDRLCAGAPIIAKIEVEAGGPTAFTIEGSRLKDLLKTLPDAALTFDFDGSDTNYDGHGGPIEKAFESLDPDDYPYWDDGLEEAQAVATVPASAFRRAVGLARPFVLLDAETRRPDLCVFESREGVIHASNMKTASLVTVPGMEESALRIHGGDAPKIIAFLDTMGDDDVEILESSLALYLKRGDGAVFGETRYNVRFPDNMKVGQIKVDPRWWEIPVGELKTSIARLHSFANRKDNRLRLKPGKKDTLLLEMALNSGRGNAQQTIELGGSGAEDDAPDLPTKGFLLDYNELKLVLSVYQEETLRMGLHPRGKS
ncbi:MAG: hypothetical protein ACYTFG_20025, partial [Planctomycetota bacterium]